MSGLAQSLRSIGTRRRPEPLKADLPTFVLAGIAVGTAGVVVAGELIRMARRRAESPQAETPATLLDATTHATRDTAAVAAAGYRATPHEQTVLFNILNGFLAAFALMRISTWGQRGGWWPTKPLTVGGRHIHHFVPGIALAFAAGGAGLATSNPRAEEILGFAFGAGTGLTFDEAALLLDLRDVYWTREGIVSVQVSFGFAAVLGATILGLRMLARGERAGVQTGAIPGMGTESHAVAGAGALA